MYIASAPNCVAHCYAIGLPDKLYPVLILLNDVCRCKVKQVYILYRSRFSIKMPIGFTNMVFKIQHFFIFLTARCSRGRRPSLAESVLSSTYWGREDDLDIEYSLIFQQKANLMLVHCLRRWLNINPALAHVTSVSGEIWWELSVIFPVKFSATRHVLLNVGPAS